ncbi:COX15/CtaA family protein [Alicyclobacillus macrosporangiidus]|uniref:Cytochrome c oxidase assembly protein subunit 15 n=1 Tax=Alicyclobacillus macrosporangiidus TaxID=392015 RepID=A0A1I7FB03_9BACL|nr:COX15/CtaA family protein [Alicyclobacillus macrosporangiidus]SFU33433.1 cytochrome c oxidase assembly protein subunit 15 [Alicyclobacillus macrosporangiidus]
MSWRLPLITSIVIVVQMTLGALVVGENAGFACPDWPLCNGALFPSPSGLVALEWVHRATALLVVVLVAAVAVQAWRRREDARLFRLSVWAVLSLLVQVVVGGLIVLVKAPGVTTTIDVLNSMFLLSLSVTIAMRLRSRAAACAGLPLNGVKSGEPRGEAYRRLRPASRAFTGAVWAAVTAGALFRHTGESEALFGRNDYLASHGQTAMPSLAEAHWMLGLHGLTALCLAGAAVFLAVRASRTRVLVRWAWGCLALVGAQAVLGILTLVTALQLALATLHWTVASVLVACAAVLQGRTAASVAENARARPSGADTDEDGRTDGVALAEPHPLR